MESPATTRRSGPPPFPAAALWLAGCALTVELLCAAPGPQPAPEPLRQDWYVTAIAGRPVGSVHGWLERGAEGTLISRSDFLLVLNRMGSRVEMASTARFRESAQGELQEVHLTLRVSEATTAVHAEVADGELVIEQQAGGTSFSRSVPLEGPLLGPEGVRRLSAAELLRPGDEIRYRTFSPELAAVSPATRRALVVETLEVDGRPVAALKVEERLEASPVATTLWLDGDGRLLRSRQTGPFGPVEVTLADADAAARAAAGGELPEESYAATLVPTQVRIPRARRLEQLKLELRHRRPELGWPDLDGPGQEVVAADADRLVLTVERRRPRRRAPFPAPVTDRTRPHLEANAYLQSDDPTLAAAAAEVVAGADDLFSAALALERWVAETMTFDMGIVLAPSVEVFADRRGTCTEYAVLLTTLARAVGIPARVVMGFVYVGGVFGGHAWTEVLVGDDWVPLDAAVVADGPADAARFAFQRTSLAEGIGELSLGPGAQLFGQVDARILELGWEGELRRAIPADMGLYTVSGDSYHNPGLGLTVTRPEGFSFADLDRTWPDDTLLTLTAPDGRSARLAVRRHLPWEDPEEAARRQLARLVPGGDASSGAGASGGAGTGEMEAGGWASGAGGRASLDGRPAFLRETAERAALALPLDGEIWLLSAEGEGAPELLREVAAGVDL